MTAADAFVHIHRPSADPRSPVLLLLHGTGGDEHDLIPLADDVAPGAAILSPRGKVSENGMNRFFRRFAEGVFDVEDLRHRAHELADWVGAARSAHALADRPIIALGFSNGANIAAAMLMLRPETLDAAVLLRPMLPYEPDAPLAGLAGRRVLISAGDRDPICPPPSARRLADLLAAGGSEVTLSMQPAGHHLVRGDMAAARAFLAA